MRRTCRQLAQIESLEVRRVLAGNMTAALNGATYEVIGDTEDNSLALYRDAGDVVLKGLDGTTINGESELRVPETALDNATNFRARGRAGNDDMFIDFTEFTWVGNAIISAGSGHDSMTVIGGTTETMMRIGGGSGRDTLALESVEVTQNMTVRAGAGRDTTMLNNVDVGNDLAYYGEGGTDFLWMDGVTVGQNAAIRMGKQNDWVVISETTVTGSAVVNGQGGNKTAFIDDQGTSSYGSLTESKITSKFTSLDSWVNANPAEETFTESDARVDAFFALLDTATAGLPTAVRDAYLGVFGDSIPAIFL